MGSRWDLNLALYKNQIFFLPPGSTCINVNKYYLKFNTLFLININFLNFGGPIFLEALGRRLAQLH
ncbi:hypothetical protein Hanom_Chr15g01356441 [Helianthus anomalus]